MATKFYGDILTLDTVRMNKYLRDDIDRNEFYKDLKIIKDNSGNISKVNINKTETAEESINGIYSSTVYKLELIIKYDKNTHIETIGFEKNKDKKTVLYSYFSKQLN